ITQGPTGEPSADDVQFNTLALNVAQGCGYVKESGQPTSFRAPGWPLFLAGIYALVGPNYPLAYLTCCLLGALSCVLTYLLAREMLSEGASRWAAVLAAVYLPHVWFSTIFLSEILFVPCLTLGVWLFLRHLKSRSLGTLAGAGLVLGWATLTRPF